MTQSFFSRTGLLNDAIETHFRSFRTLSLGVQYLIALNPDFLLLVVKDCLHYAPTQVRLRRRQTHGTRLYCLHCTLHSHAGQAQRQAVRQMETN